MWESIMKMRLKIASKGDSLKHLIALKSYYNGRDWLLGRLALPMKSRGAGILSFFWGYVDVNKHEYGHEMRLSVHLGLWNLSGETIICHIANTNYIL